MTAAPLTLPTPPPPWLSILQLSAHEARTSGGASAKGKGKAGITAGPFYSELQAEVGVMRHKLNVCTHKQCCAALATACCMASAVCS